MKMKRDGEKGRKTDEQFAVVCKKGRGGRQGMEGGEKG